MAGYEAEVERHEARRGAVMAPDDALAQAQRRAGRLAREAQHDVVLPRRAVSCGDAQASAQASTQGRKARCYSTAVPHFACCALSVNRFVGHALSNSANLYRVLWNQR